MAPSAGTLRVGRYFAVLLGLFVVLYGIVFWPHQPRTPKLGLDLQGGAQVILKAQTTNGKAPSKAALDQARQIITNRVNGLGVSSAEVVTQGNDRIVVSVPGASANDIKDVGGTALLQFRPLLMDAQPVSAPTSTATGSASASATAAPSGSATGTAKASTTAKPASSSAKPSAHGRVVPLAAGSSSPSATPKTSASTSPKPSASTSPSPTGSVDPSIPIDQWKIVGIDWCAAGVTTPPTGSKCIPATPDAVAALATSDPTASQQLNAGLQSWPCNNITKPLDVPGKPLITCSQDNATKYLLGPV
ncbi:MAG TPA: hypothetical protein VH298_15835, partial [Jatrophihabitans sp.]|nr:hypothetical protein [Jatrophihabitans sp.]